ncbi:MAG TPA: hypothetical protein VF509_12010 [Sphingobium sp.]
MTQKSIVARAAAGTGALCLIICGAPLLAAPKAPPRALSKLLDCRAVTDPAARLACYDEQVAAIESATARDEVVVMDKEDVRKTRRSLFGFTMPKLPFLGGGDKDDGGKDESQVNEIEDVIKNLKALPYGIWVFTLEDGSQWQTSDPMPYGTPKPGHKIMIKRAALSAYKASVNGWAPVKVKRVG